MIEAVKLKDLRVGDELYHWNSAIRIVEVLRYGMIFDTFSAHNGLQVKADRFMVDILSDRKKTLDPIQQTIDIHGDQDDLVFVFNRVPLV